MKIKPSSGAIGKVRSRRASLATSEGERLDRDRGLLLRLGKEHANEGLEGGEGETARGLNLEHSLNKVSDWR